MPYGKGNGDGGVYGKGNGDGGVASASASLTLGTPGATSVPLTLTLSAGATLVSWSVQRSPKGLGTWTTIAAGLTDLEYTATGLDPKPAEYDFQGIDVVTTTSATTNVVAVATAEQAYLPLVENRNWIMPGGGTMGSKTIPGTESRILRLRPGGIDQGFGEVEILMLNPFSTSYQVKAAWIGNMDATDVEGFTLIVSTPVTVPAGDGLIWQEDGSDSIRPGVLSLGRFAVTMGSSNGFQLAIALSDGAPACFWGGNAIGYDVSINKIPRDISLSWDLSGAEESFGIQPCIAVIFYALDEPGVTLPVLGDSWIHGYGDNDQPFPGAVGIPYRLEQSWGAAGVKIYPVNVGRDGATTAVQVGRADWVVDTFAPRCAAVQYYSINNDMQGVGNADVEANFGSIEASMSPQPVLPLILAGNNNGSSGWWSAVKALEEACRVSRPDTVDVSAPIVNAADGTIVEGHSYGMSHPGNDGYDAMAEWSRAPIRAWCEAMAGQSL